MRTFLASLLLLFVCLPIGMAETVKDREGAVRQDKAAMENDARWIYNDVQRGFKEARLTGKPLLVVLRCVPCLSCMGIDSAVLLQDAELAPLLDQFVCVRVINANALDLALFQFDFDLSFSTMLFNGDGTVYGRYGSWTHQKNSQDQTTAGYKRALAAGLSLHKSYPANRAEVAGKQGGPLPFLSAIDSPALAGKYQRDLNWQGNVVQSCVHCHMIGDSLRAWYREQAKPVPAEWIYPMPAPESVGLTLASDQIATVTAVAPGSIAAAAGLQSGDEIAALGGQRLISIADFSWVLHRAPESGGALAAIVRRGGAEQAATLTLPDRWRFTVDSSQRVAAWPMRGMATGGMVLEDLSDEDRRRRGLSVDQMALFVKGLGQYGKHAAAKKAGFLKEDIVIAIDGKTARMTESALFGHLLQTQFPGQHVRATVLRNGAKVDLSLPMQ